MSLPNSARTIIHTVTVAVSGLFIVAAVAFGAVALAFAGLLIGAAGALTAKFRPRQREALITLNATRTGKGWIVDPSDR